MGIEWTIEACQKTDPGRRRRYNEDYVDFFEPSGAGELAEDGRLYIIADGAGGRTVGQVASRYAVQKVLYEHYRSREPDLSRRLARAFSAANADLFKHARQQLGLFRMGTTLVAAAIRGDQLVVANVGNSRAYLVRRGRIERITRDHSVVARLVEEGSISEEEAKVHPQRDVVLRRLGFDGGVTVDIFTRRLTVGYTVVLCTDGLVRHIAEREIAQIVITKKPEEAAKYLIHLANRRGGEDNVSVTIIRVQDTAPQTLLEGLPPKPRPDPPQWRDVYDALTLEKQPKRLSFSPKTVGRAMVGTLSISLLICALLFWHFGTLIPSLLSLLVSLPPAPSTAVPLSVASPTATLIPTFTSTALPTPKFGPSPDIRPTLTLTSPLGPTFISTPLSTPTFSPAWIPTPTPSLISISATITPFLTITTEITAPTSTLTSLATAPSPISTPGFVSNPKYGGANVRAGPGLDYEVLGFIPNKEKVEIIGQEGQWYKILWPDQAEGAWIFSRLVLVGPR